MNTRHRARDPVDPNDAGIARLLSQRFGDRHVYLSEETDRQILETAIDRGLVSRDGLVTAAGHRLYLREGAG